MSVCWSCKEKAGPEPLHPAGSNGHCMGSLCQVLGDVISMEEGSLGARSIKSARTLVNLGIYRDLLPPITEGLGMGGPGHSLFNNGLFMGNIQKYYSHFYG
ncbi:Uncharacterized protein Fot_28688 [Forsythia ovata]|uniref:Uncharacterized protein n=1 Tax=Forsythia ovata TaxID=205694 RepID=A0ABD1TPT5_9LAMI